MSEISPQQKADGTGDQGNCNGGGKPSSFEIVTRIIEIGIGALVGVALVVVGCLQYSVYKRQSVIFASQLVAAQDTEFKQLRPYVTVDEFVFPCDQCADKGRFKVMNLGQTPATNIIINIAWDDDPRCRTDTTGAFGFDTSPGNNNKAFVISSLDEHKALPKDGSDHVTFSLAKSGKSPDLASYVAPGLPITSICIFGEIRYDTVFGGDIFKEHPNERPITEFCRGYDPELPKDNRISLCRSHNSLH